MRKLNPEDWNYEWVGNDRCEDAGDLEKLIISRRADLVIWAEISDDQADYSYDDWALVQLDNDFYLLSTAGCSCPSPSETWGVNVGPSTLDDILNAIERGDYDGYTVPGRQKQEFLDAINAAKRGE